MTLTSQELSDRWRRERAYHDCIRHQELVAMATKGNHTGIPLASTGHKPRLPNARLKANGELEIDAPKRKRTLNQIYQGKKKQKWKAAK